MKNYYLNDGENIKDKSEEEIKKELITSINNVILELNLAHENYDNAVGELIDYYSYQIKAFQSKYDYLIKTIKDMNITQFKKII